MNVCVVGLGFVGLSMSVVMASKNFKVIGVDNDLQKIEMLNNGKVPFFEPKLADLMKKTSKDTFMATTNLESAIKKSEIIFICVGTPSNQDGSVDLQFLKNTSFKIGEILKNLSNPKTIVVKSTVPPNTTKNVVKKTLEEGSAKQSGKDFGLCMNPEFLREGSAIDDMNSPHLVVIGTDDEFSKNKMCDFYTNLYKENVPTILNTNIVNAELIKYTNNAFLATKISFINTIANICNRIPGADVEVIANAIGKDPRIGSLFLKAGPGFGGSCFPKDISGFLTFSSSLGYDPALIRSTQKVNQDQVSIILEMVKQQIPNFKDKTFSILGLSFKNNTDDIRESVSIKVVKDLLDKQAKIKVHDPLAMENFKKLFSDKIQYFSNINECLASTDCCIILTDWKEYFGLTAEDFKKTMNYPFVIDARRIYNPLKMNSIIYSAIGYGK